MNDIHFIDLFAGTGAFSLVLEENPICKCVFSNDFLPYSKQMYDLNNDSSLVLADLNHVNIDDIPRHMLLCAGFPCQSFSIAGKQKGFKDERINVFWKLVEILEKRKPKVFILENVKNLISHDKGNTFKVIKQKLKDCGYRLKSKVLDTSKISCIPQHRERIYIVGLLDDDIYEKFNFDFPEVENIPIVRLLESHPSEQYYYSERYKVYKTVNEGVTKHVNTNTIYQYRRHYVRENKSRLCPTLTANMGEGGHNVPLLRDNYGIRKLTPRECFNLQGFPHDFKLPNICDSKLYKLAGNAISIPVVRLIITRIINLLVHQEVL